MSALWLMHMKYKQGVVNQNKTRLPKICVTLNFAKVEKKLTRFSNVLRVKITEVIQIHGCIKCIDLFHTWKQKQLIIMSQTSTYERISELLMYTGQQFLFFKIV